MDRRFALVLAGLLGLAALAFCGSLWALGERDDLLAILLFGLGAATIHTQRIALREGRRGGGVA